MSLPRASWISTARSGEIASKRPSMCERKTASCSVIFVMWPRLKIWKPPLSVRIGPSQPDEGVQAAEFGDDLFARPQREVIGIGQHHLRPGCREAARSPGP